MSDANDDLQSAQRDCGTKPFESENAAAFTDAACFIRQGKSANADGANHDARQHAEQQQIIRWIEEAGVVRFTDEQIERIPLLSDDTSEHEVRLPFSGKRVFKKTWARFYGQIPVWRDGKLERILASPADYLERQALQNEVFASDLRLEGVNISDKPSMVLGQPSGQPSFVISQGFIEAADGTNPIPSMQQIAAFLAEHGFSQVPGSYFGWVRYADGVAIVDAKLDNFILSVEGVVPIDLQMARLPEVESERPRIIAVSR